MAKVLPNVKFDLAVTYLDRIKNSVGSEIFKSNFGWVNEKLEDLTENGELSCSSYVSGILIMSGLIKAMHLTITGTKKDMGESGWYEIKQLKPGAVVLWEEELKQSGRWCAHLGFCVDEKTAISNLEPAQQLAKYPGRPNQHSIDYDGTRKIEKIFWHPKLDQ